MSRACASVTAGRGRLRPAEQVLACVLLDEKPDGVTVADITEQIREHKLRHPGQRECAAGFPRRRWPICPRPRVIRRGDT